MLALAIWSAVVATILAIAYRWVAIGAIVFLYSFAVIFLGTYLVLGTNYVYGGLSDIDSDQRNLPLID